MLASDVIDAVYIGLPNGLHKEWTIKALQSGKHVLCEKPLASNAAEVREIIAAAGATGLKAMEAFMYRFHPQIDHMKQLLMSGAIGDLKLIRASFGFFLDRPDDVRWLPDLAGGVLMDMGCYCVNVSRLIGGGNPTSVTAHEILAPGGVDATLVGTMEFPGDLLSTLDCSFRTGVVLQQALSISGTEGRLSLSDPFHSDEEPVTITIDKASHIDNGGPVEVVEIPGANHYHLMLEHFADAVLNDHPVAYTLQDSLGCMRTIDALKESARTGKRVEVGG
jgi:predicted dehydrogenase